MRLVVRVLVAVIVLGHVVPTTLKVHDQGDDEPDRAGHHQDHAKRIVRDVRQVDVDRSGHDGSDHEEGDTTANTHGSFPSDSLIGRGDLYPPGRIQTALAAQAP